MSTKSWVLDHWSGADPDVFVRGRSPWRARGARACNGGLRAESPVRSEVRGPGGGSGANPLKLKLFGSWTSHKAAKFTQQFLKYFWHKAEPLYAISSVSTGLGAIATGGGKAVCLHPAARGIASYRLLPLWIRHCHWLRSRWPNLGVSGHRDAPGSPPMTDNSISNAISSNRLVSHADGRLEFKGNLLNSV